MTELSEGLTVRETGTDEHYCLTDFNVHSHQYRAIGLNNKRQEFVDYTDFAYGDWEVVEEAS